MSASLRKEMSSADPNLKSYWEAKDGSRSYFDFFKRHPSLDLLSKAFNERQPETFFGRNFNSPAVIFDRHTGFAGITDHLKPDPDATSPVTKRVLDGVRDQLIYD